MTTIPSNQPRRKISYKEQKSVDEILQLVQDQTRKISLSKADYQTQKRLERTASQTDEDSDFFEDSSYGTASSEFSSYSPPATQESAFSSFSWPETNSKQRKFSNGEMPVNKRCLPPLDPIKSRTSFTPPRPPSRLTTHESMDSEIKRPTRPMSARGQRTITTGRMRGLTT